VLMLKALQPNRSTNLEAVYYERIFFSTNLGSLNP
jgi:hypothetical protein